jgi:hypothetical protein
VPVSGVGPPALDLCQHPETLAIDDVRRPVECGELLLEAVVVHTGLILGQDFLEPGREHAHAIHASERVFAEQ